MSAETTPIVAHGGTLVSRVIAAEEYATALELAAALPSVTVDGTDRGGSRAYRDRRLQPAHGLYGPGRLPARPSRDAFG